MKFSVELPVQFRDVDCLGHVNSATYLQWMETARIEFMRHLGQIEHGFRPRFIIASCRCEYMKPIIDQRRVIVSVWISRMGTRSWDFDYVIGKSEEVVFAFGRTTQVAFDYKSESTIPISDELRKDLQNRFGRPLAFKEAI